MIPRNPRKFSLILAFAAALGVVTSTFVSICFEAGNGRFAAGVSSAAGYLQFYGFGVIALAFIGGMAALLLGRAIGVTITALFAVGGLLTLMVTSYLNSTPISRFQRLVWSAAPRSLPIYEHRMLKSFSDGTTYTFVIAASPKTVTEICGALQLSRVTEEGLDLPCRLSPYFSDAHFPQETILYKGGSIELAHVPAEGKAYVVRFPTVRPR